MRRGSPPLSSPHTPRTVPSPDALLPRLGHAVRSLRLGRRLCSVPVPVRLSIILTTHHLSTFQRVVCHVTTWGLAWPLFF